MKLGHRAEASNTPNHQQRSGVQIETYRLESSFMSGHGQDAAELACSSSTSPVSNQLKVLSERQLHQLSQSVGDAGHIRHRVGNNPRMSAMSCYTNTLLSKSSQATWISKH